MADMIAALIHQHCGEGHLEKLRHNKLLLLFIKGNNFYIKSSYLQNGDFQDYGEWHVTP